MAVVDGGSERENIVDRRDVDIFYWMLVKEFDFIVLFSRSKIIRHGRLFTARQQPLLIDAASIAVKHHLYIARTDAIAVTVSTDTINHILSLGSMIYDNQVR